MPKVLYIGNKLAQHGYTPTSVEYLGSQLMQLYPVDRVSAYKNWVFRLLDALTTLVKNRKAYQLVLIDTFSTWNFYYAWLCARFARFLGIPYILLINGGNFPVRLANSPRLTRLLLRPAYVIITQSDYLKEACKKRGFDAKVIPNFIHVENYSYKPRPRVGPHLLWVRSFQKLYNPAMAIEVVKALRTEIPDIQLTMVGPDKDGSLKACLEKVKKLELEDHVTFTGKLSKKEWINQSSKADIFINTTNFDNRPISVLEAMALGFPIVSTNAGGLPYLIEEGQTGLLVEKGNTEGMVHAIQQLLANPDWAAQLSQNARKEAEKYDWSQVKPQWDALIKEVCS